jgi:hypothetical protein
MNGTVVFNITIQDSGGTAHGGVNSSVTWHIFAIHVLPVNQRPMFELPSWIIHVREAPQTQGKQSTFVPTCREHSSKGLDGFSMPGSSNISRAAVATNIIAGPQSPEEDKQTVTFTLVPLQCRVPSGALPSLNATNDSIWMSNCPGLFGGVTDASAVGFDSQLFEHGSEVRLLADGTFVMSLEPERFGVASFLVRLEDNGKPHSSCFTCVHVKLIFLEGWTACTMYIPYHVHSYQMA